MPLLTAASVAKLKPQSKRREVPDAGCAGLRLCIFPSGKRSWVMRFRRNGRSAKLTLGPVDTGVDTDADPVIGAPLTLAAARRLASEVNRQRAMGRDPISDHKADRARRQSDAVEREQTSYPACAQAFILEYASVHTRRWQTTARMLGIDNGEVIPKGLCDRWRDKSVRDIDANDVHTLVQEVRKRGVPGLRRKRTNATSDAMGMHMHSVLSKFFAWLISQRVIDTNPCATIDRPRTSAPRERVLSDDEIRSFWKACDTLTPAFAAVFKLMLITGQRRGEVAGMTRDELNANVWTLPPARTKNKRTHTVTLPPLACAVIASVKQGDKYVFTYNGRTPVGGFVIAKQRLDAAMPGVAPWRLHDLRRNAVVGMARAGADLHVIERVVNHQSGTFKGIVGVYQRHKFESECARALEAWERLLISIVEPTAANVIPLRG